MKSSIQLIALAIASLGLFQSASAQETIVSIGTASVQSQAPATPSAESYTQTVYEASQIGTSGYIVRLAFKRNDNIDYTNAMDWDVYLGHTTVLGFFSTNADQIPLANLTQVFDGQVVVTATEVIVNFDTPFYYNGTDKLAVAVNEVTFGKHYSYLKATNYNNGSAYNPSKAFKNYSTPSSVSAANPATCDQISSLAYQPNVDITFSTCLWPTALTTSDPTTSSIDVGWTNGLSESAWEVEAVPTGQAQGSGVVQSANSNPHTFTGLDHSTIYDFYVRADCGSNEYSLWGGLATDTTLCGINTCFEEDFNSYNHLDEPLCFTTVSPAITGAATGNPGDLFLHIGGFGDTYVSTPEFASLNAGSLVFKGKSNLASYNTVTVGTITDPNNTGTFTALQSIPLTTTWTTYAVDFSGYAGSDKYICFQYLGGVNGNTFVNVDDLQFDAGICVFNKVYVDDSATGNNDGTSWTDAYNDLQDALNNYNGDDIWVAEGTYKPHGSDRTATFSIPSGARIYGGFNTTEFTIFERDVAANPSVLSGDLNGDDNGTLLDTEPTRQDNSYHVVTLKGDVQNVVLDGFTISDGNANGPIDNSCATPAANRVYHARGGAIYANPYTINDIVSADITNCILENHTSPENSVYTAYAPCGITDITFDFDFDRCIVRNNHCGTLSSMVFTASGGYGIVSTGSITNSLFHDNETTASLGSVFYMVTSTVNNGTHTALTLDIENNTFANNVSGDGSTFYTIRAQSSTFTNNIVWDNGSSSPFNASPTPVINSSLVEGGINGSMNVDPVFADPQNNDFSLDCTSPAIDAGDGGISLSNLDLAANPREYQTVDLGAYEYQTSFWASASESSVCLGETVTFTTTGGSNISWTGGVTEGVPFTPTATDTYIVTAEDSEGCSSSRSVSVTVELSVPNASVSATSEVCSGSSATVTIASSGTGADYYLRDDSNNSVVDGPIAGTGGSMDFNTGVINSATTYHVFATPQVQTDYAVTMDGVNDLISLGTNNRGITTQFSVSMWVNAGSTGATQFIMGKYDGIRGMLFFIDANGKVNIDGRDGTGVYRASGPSTTSVDDNQWHHVSATINVTTGTWKVYVDGNLEVTANHGGGSSLNSTTTWAFGGHSPSFYSNVSLNQISAWNVELDASQILANYNTCLTGTETGLIAYFQIDEGSGLWLTDDSPTATDVAIINATVDPWIVGNALNCFDVGCDLQLTETVTVNVTSGYNLTETSTVCEGESYTFPDGSSQTINSQTVHTSNLTTVVAGCDSIIETTVNINTSYDLAESAAICEGEDYTFPDGTIQTINTQTVYTSSLQTVVSGCDSIIETTVNINPTFDMTETVSVCAGDSYTFPDGSMQNNITSQVVYISDLSTMSFACDSVIETTVNVNTLDNSTSLNGNTITATQSGATYKWLDCDNGNAMIPGETGQSFTGGNGNYAVEITNGNCVDTSTCTMIITVGIEAASNSEINLYPNPARDLINISGATGSFSVEILNVVGEVVLVDNRSVINVEHLASGPYIARIRSNGGVLNRRFTKM